MITANSTDYRNCAKKELPRFLFDYIDGGSYSEYTLNHNTLDLSSIALRQRILKGVGEVNLGTEILGCKMSMPIIAAPVGATGMYARRGEVQVAKAMTNKGLYFTQSTVSVCPVEEVAEGAGVGNLWFQLYVLKDRAFMKNVLERAQNLGVKTLVFTVDMPTPGARYRDMHSGMEGSFAAQRRVLQAMFKPAWALNVGILGRPLDLGNISKYLNRKMELGNYTEWLAANFDPSIGWKDLEWIRDFWKGNMIIKGILDKDDAKDAIKFGANGIVVSNHGGRQLDGTLSTARALPPIVDAVGNELTVLADSGIRSGLDVVRMLALGAKGVFLGRPITYALASHGQKGVEHLMNIFAKEMRVAMTLTGVKNISQITRDNLAS